MKLTSIVVGLAALFSLQANAADKMTASGPITVAKCATLSGDINVNLSKDVYAAYDCETSATASWGGAVSASGQKKTRSHTCSSTKPGLTSIWSNTQCSADNTQVTITGSSYYAASTSGGKITEYSLGGGGAGKTCDKATPDTCAGDLQAALTALAGQ